jgi:hypothetical protein
MANPTTPFGLQPLRMMNGSANMQLSEYTIAAAYSTAIFRGDLVELTGTTNQIQQAAAANSDNLGVFWGCEYVDAAGKQKFSKYWPGTAGATNIRAYVWADPDTLFLIRTDATGLAVANLGTLVDHEVGTGNTTTGMSSMLADVSGGTGTSGKTLRLMELWGDPDNVYGANAIAVVQIYEHALRGAVGAGV